MSLGTLESSDGVSSGNSCSKCGSDRDPASPVCASCGFYAKLNTFVEVDEMDQFYAKGQFERPQEENASQNEYVRAFQSVPAWAWKLFGVVAFVSMVCMAFNIVVPFGSPLRIVGAVGLVFFGSVIAAAAHAIAGIQVAREEMEVGGWDIVISPFRIWRHVLMRLPKLFKCTAFGVGGAWAVIMAHVIIGVPYWQLMTAGEPPKKKKKAMPEVIAGMAGAAESAEMSMEEAMEGLAGDGEGKEAEKDKPALTLQEAMRQVWEGAFADGEPGEISEEDAEKLNKPRRVKLRALAIGVKTNEEGDVMSLIVAVKSEGQWRVAGAVSNGLTPEWADSLKSQIKNIRRDKPFIPSNLNATWIEPIIYCNVEADYTPADDKFEKFSLQGIE